MGHFRSGQLQVVRGSRSPSQETDQTALLRFNLLRRQAIKRRGPYAGLASSNRMSRMIEKNSAESMLPIAEGENG